MATNSERKALLFVAAVLLLGSVVRVSRSLSLAPAVTAQSRDAIAKQIAAVENLRGSSAAAKAPQRAAEKVNINTASVTQLQALPGVGPVLAERIKAFRDSAGLFNSLDQLDRVKGIGPAMLKELSSRVTF